MARKVCIFCGSSPVTKEDLYPKWMLRLLAQDFETKRSRKGSRTKAGASFWSTDRPSRVIVKCVCGTCNNVWMSDIESAAQPALTRMIHGEDGIELDTATQEAVATWACLKTMIGAYSSGKYPIPEDWLEYFYRERRPPQGWHVMTTRYTGTLLQVFDSHRFLLPVTARDQAIPTSAQEKGILTAFIVGHLAVQVRALREPNILKIRSNVVGLWPSSPLTLLWPPDVEVRDGPTLENFRRMGFEPGPKLFNLPPR